MGYINNGDESSLVQIVPKRPPQKTERLTKYIQDKISQDPNIIRALTTISENRAQM